MPVRAVLVCCLIACVLGAGGTALAAWGVFSSLPTVVRAVHREVPSIIVTNVGEKPVEILELRLCFLKRNQRHPPTVLAPGKGLRLVFRKDRLAEPDVTLRYRTGESVFSFEKFLFTGDHSAVTVTIDGRWIRVGHHDETGWRAACGFLARRVVNEE